MSGKLTGKIDHIDKWHRIHMKLKSCAISDKNELAKNINIIENVLNHTENKITVKSPVKYDSNGNITDIIMKSDKTLFCYDNEGKIAKLYDFIGKPIRVEYIVKYYTGEYGNGVFIRLKNIQGL